MFNTNRLPRLTVGSRVLDGDTLRNVIQAMNVAVAQTPWSERFAKSIIVGEGLLKVHARRCSNDGGDIEDFYVAVTAPENADAENVDKVLKKMTTGIKRISAKLQRS
jgi:hypothetical protein